MTPETPRRRGIGRTNSPPEPPECLCDGAVRRAQTRSVVCIFRPVWGQ